MDFEDDLDAENAFESFYTDSMTPQDLDLHLARGWRQFGGNFFRYKQTFHENQIVKVVPLRIRLDGFAFRKSQNKIIQKNKDVKILIRDAFIDDEKHQLFEVHKQRFKDNKPYSLYDFLAYEPAHTPTHTQEVCLFDNEQMYAASFIDVAKNSISSIYAMFHHEHAHKSPGNHTLFLEILYALQQQKTYLYLGYAYDVPSFYDYKKNFHNLEKYDWKGSWIAFEQ